MRKYNNKSPWFVFSGVLIISAIWAMWSYGLMPILAVLGMFCMGFIAGLVYKS